MNPAPPPNVPGRTEAERFNNALRMVLSVSKEDLLKAEAKRKQERVKKRAKR